MLFGYVALNVLLDWRRDRDRALGSIVAVATGALLALPLYVRWILLKDQEASGHSLVVAPGDALRGIGLTPWTLIDGWISTGLSNRLRESLPAPLVTVAGLLVYTGAVAALLWSGLRLRRGSQPVDPTLSQLALLAAVYLGGMAVLRFKVHFEIQTFRFLVPVLPVAGLLGARALLLPGGSGRAARGAAWTAIAGMGLAALLRLYGGASLRDQPAAWEAGRWIREHAEDDEPIIVLGAYSRLNPYVENRLLIGLLDYAGRGPSPKSLIDQWIWPLSQHEGRRIVIFPRLGARGAEDPRWPEERELLDHLAAKGDLLAIEDEGPLFVAYRVQTTP